MPTILDFQIKPDVKNQFTLEIFERDKAQPLELAMSAIQRELLHYDDYLIQADAFALVLFTAQGDCLKPAADNLSIFLNTAVNATQSKTRFIFTCRYLFELDEKRVGTVQELPLGDLSRPEALGMMQKLPHLSNSSFEEKFKAYEVFDGEI